MKLDRLKEVVKSVQVGGNIHEHLDLIAGLPYEDYDSFKNSFDEIYALKPNQLQLGFLKVVEGSYMYEHAKEYGIIYHDRPPYEVLSTNWITYDDVLRIKKVEEMLEVYYNSGQFEITMKMMDAIYDSAFDFFQRLGEFYESRGYFGMSHSRIKRCEILLEFMEYNFTNAKCSDNEKQGLNIGNSSCCEIITMIQEALIFDLYYRENCKSRPAWAIDTTSFKNATRKFCENGKLSHVEPFHYRFPDKNQKMIDRLPDREEVPVWVLFHYDDRDPLDNQARVEYVNYEQD